MDFIDIASFLQYESFDGMKEVINYGEDGIKFYIILKGVVSVSIPNPEIKSFNLELNRFQNLLKWKETDYDPRE